MSVGPQCPLLLLSYVALASAPAVSNVAPAAVAFCGPAVSYVDPAPVDDLSGPVTFSPPVEDVAPPAPALASTPVPSGESCQDEF